MQEVNVIIHQIIILGLLGLTGFIVSKTRFLPENTGEILSKVVVNLTAPILIFTTISKYSFTSSIITDGVCLFISGLVFIMLTYLIARILSRLLKLKGDMKNIYELQSMFGNVVFLAYPLLASLFGEKGIMYAVFFNIANDFILWTFGIYIVSKQKSGGLLNNLKHLLNGNIIAFLLGLACMLLNLQYFVNANQQVASVYNLIYDAFNPLGKSTIYLSMLFIGMILAGIKIKSASEIKKRYPIFVLSFFKLLFVPVLSIMILRFFKAFIDPFVIKVIVLQLAMPCATIVSAIAIQHESDYEFATECVFFSTILSIITLPFIAYLLNILI